MMNFVDKIHFFFKDIKFNCRFAAEYFEFDATDFYLEPDAVLSCEGKGYTSTSTNGSGIASSTGGSGAGHATIGGNSASNTGGSVYGSIYEPNVPGARGGAVGGTLGSRGGGRIRINVGHAFVLDGNLNADAADATANTGNLRLFSSGKQDKVDFKFYLLQTSKTLAFLVCSSQSVFVVFYFCTCLVAYLFICLFFSLLFSFLNLFLHSYPTSPYVAIYNCFCLCGCLLSRNT